MKPQDLFTLYHSLNCKAKSTPLTAVSFDHLGWSPEDIVISQKRLQHMGLIDRRNNHPNFDRIRLFLLEAISFWWPMTKVDVGQGLALSIPSQTAMNNKIKNIQWVWPCDGERTEGEVIKPLWPDLPRLAMRDREFLEFFSCVEVLRFDQHPLKSTAQNLMSQELDKMQKLGSQIYPDIEQDFLELKDSHFQILVNSVCQNGFKPLTLQKASLLTQLPLKYYVERWDTDQALRLWIAGKYHEQFYQFLGPLLGQLHEMNKGHLAMVLETFLNFIESNEDYYRITLWAYLEKDVSIQEMSRRSQKSFFETVLTLFKKSKPEAIEKAEFYSYLFTTAWRMYAAFIWSESKSLGSSVNQSRLKNQIRNFVMRSVFEEY